MDPDGNAGDDQRRDKDSNKHPPTWPGPGGLDRFQGDVSTFSGADDGSAALPTAGERLGQPPPPPPFFFFFFFFFFFLWDQGGAATGRSVQRHGHDGA